MRTAQNAKILALHERVTTLFSADEDEDIASALHEAVDVLEQQLNAMAKEPEPDQLAGIIAGHAHQHARHHGAAATRKMLLTLANQIHKPFDTSTLPVLTRESQEKPAISRRPATFPITLSPTALAHVKAEAAWLSDPARTAEHFVAFSINQNGEICGRIDRSDNHPTRCRVSPEGVAREAIHDGAVGLLAMHNHLRRDEYCEAQNRHWSGACEASEADVATTAALRRECEARGVYFIDHLVIGPRALPYSFIEAEQPRRTLWDDQQRRLETRGY